MMTDLKTLRVLIVDDEPDNLMLLQTLFKHFKAQVSTAADGVHGMKLFAENRFDLILLDIQMPVTSGETILQSIRSHSDPLKRTVPVIAVTAHAMAGDRERLLRVGFNDYISKPIDVQVALEIAQKCIKVNGAYW